MASHLVHGLSDGSLVKSRERFLFCPDRLPRLPLLPGVVDIVIPEGAGVFEGVFEAERVVAPEEEVDVPSLEGVFGVEPGRPVVFKFEAEEEPSDEAVLDVEG